MDEFEYTAANGHLMVARDGHFNKSGEWQWHYFNALHSSKCRCVTDPESWY